MKLSNSILAVFMIMCMVNSICAAPNTGSINTATTQSFIPKPDGIHANLATGTGASKIVTANSGTQYAVKSSVSNAVSFTSTPTSGTCIDNTKKVAVYMPAISNPMYMEYTGSTVNIPVAFDPMTTAMLFEYNPDYLGDSAIASKLTTANYGVLIVPTTEMSTTAASAINSYIASGGSVWFLNDPCMSPTYTSSIQLTPILGSGVSSSIGSSTVSVVNTDDITKGLPASFVPVGTAAKTAEFRSLPAMSGTISGLNYQVLIGTNARAMLVKFENPSNGARVIYSNPNMFISGGTASYFNAATATKLFTQTKAWIMKFAQNPNSVEVTYPNTDKQLTVTCDDEECTDYDVMATPMFNAETALGLTPSSLNTFFVIPNPDLIASRVNYYTQYGDTHTLHPHEFLINGVWSNCDWENTAHTVATDDSYMTTLKNFINTAMSSTNYGFTSFRFPFTTYCQNSMQAVSDSGFVIDSSSGCDGAATGTQVDNTLFLPKQTLVNNVKTNVIEYELPADFDLNYPTGTAFAAANDAFTNQFKNGNFPMNFIVAGHYQGMVTNCGVSGWGVTSTGLTAGLSTILSTQKGANPNYATLNTLANYINGIRSATIKATYDGTSATTVTVTNSKAITGFTLKLAGTVNSVTCDGSALTVKTDGTTGAMYVTKDLSATTHTFVMVLPTTVPLSAQYISDTIPLAMTAGQSYAVSVTMHNAGTSAWDSTSNIKLGGVGDGSGDASKFGPTRILIPSGTEVAPNTNYTFSFNMKAPSAGMYNPKYQMLKEGVAWFGQQLSKTVTVSAAPLSAQYVSDTIPSVMIAGQKYAVSVTMLNNGMTTWNSTSAIRLGGVGDGSGDAAKFGPTRIYIATGTNVAPKASYTFNFTMTAPSAGTYNPKYQMLKEGVAWFGQQLSKMVSVK
jgi:hypothetical protein